MRSTEKVSMALDRAESLAEDPQAAPTVKAAAAMLALGRGHLEQMIPTDPDLLDELLTNGAQWMLDLRSDDVVQHESELGQLGETTA